MTVEPIRDWRGVQTQLPECSTEELLAMLLTAVHTTQQVADFIKEVQVELVLRGELPADPGQVV